MRQILFLDIDGVLNAGRTWPCANPVRRPDGCSQDPDGTRVWRRWPLKDGGDTLGILDVQLVHRVREITEEGDCEVVLATSWKDHVPESEIRGLLAAAGWESPPIAGHTPDLGPTTTRADEVHAWLNSTEAAGVTGWVALDDAWGRDLRPTDRVIQVDPDIGITEDDVTDALLVLADQIPIQ